MTLSDKLTTARLFIIFLILFFLIFPFSNNEITNYNGLLNGYVTWNSLVALGLFVVAAITDVLDGRLARKNNNVSNYGKLIDPLADKILINSIIITFSFFGLVPIWLALLFIIRDAFVDGLRLMAVNKGKVIDAKFLGKQKTIWQFLGIIFIFIFPGYYYGSTWWALIPLYVAAIFSLLSWAYYYKLNIGLIFTK